MAEELSLPERKVLLALHELGTASPSQVAERTGQGSVEVMNASSWLRAKGLLQRDEKLHVTYALGPEGQGYAERGLPERRLVEVLAREGGQAPLDSLARAPEFLANPDEVKIATGQAKRKGLIEIQRWGNVEQIALKRDFPAIRALLEAPPQLKSVMRYVLEHPETTVRMHYSGLESNLSNEFPPPSYDAGQILQELIARGMIVQQEEESESVDIAEELHQFDKLGSEAQYVVETLIAERGPIALTGAPDEFQRFPAYRYGSAIKELETAGMVERIKSRGTTVVTLTDKGRHVSEEILPDERILEQLKAGEQPEEALDPQALRALLDRQNVLRGKETVAWTLQLTSKGRDMVAQGVTLEEAVAQLTPELLQSGKWREAKFRPYDVTTFAPEVTGGKKHPLRRIIDDIRAIFLEMGFTEIDGPFVHTTFWDMDALFVPQDHPAREMQDTFYLAEPARRALPDKGKEAGYVKAVQGVHERGGKTGSRGWGYAWSKAEAERLLLRTHTTVETIRHLHGKGDTPTKAFIVGRVFRKEAMDATHLPEFHQVDGIVMEPGANLRMLIGLLREFYGKMGFEDVRVRPAYFPYTEPSLEVEVKYNNRWMELGGAGIFRPEVTQPAGVKHPVLAWGLGLERLAMMKLGLKDIRSLYESDLDWLRRVPAKL